MFSAAGLKRAGSMRLPTNGAAQRCGAGRCCTAADAYGVKSPASIAAVGTKANRSAGVSRIRVPW